MTVIILYSIIAFTTYVGIDESRSNRDMEFLKKVVVAIFWPISLGLVLADILDYLDSIEYVEEENKDLPSGKR